MTDSSPRHLSLLRSLGLADFFTIANAGAGMAAILLALRFVAAGRPALLYGAALLVPLAALFDFLDGRIARLRRQSSALGRELDSLADVISFGVAPATIACAAGLDFVLDQVMLVFFTVCGAARLARYNVTAETLADDSGKVTHFEGTPIPTSVVPLALLMLAYHFDALAPTRLLGVSLHATTLLFVVSGCLMVSRTIRIPKP
jgi:CDP-diacylglycerol--serine O-phosphatidyltransferase